MRILALIILSLFIGCTNTSPISEEELMEKELEKKFDAFKKDQSFNCRQNAILEAEIYVDSIIYQMTRFSILEDSVEMISKPNRPDRPKYLEISDPGPIKPFEEK